MATVASTLFSEHPVQHTILLPTAVVGALIATALAALAAENDSTGRPWTMHVIDASSRGADGVRLADVNGDGRMDIATGWEEGGITRVYVQPPGADAVRDPWPAVTVGNTPNVEDAVLVDLDADGRTDVVTCCEGGTRTMFVHWAPKDPQAYLDPAAWKTEPLPPSEKRMAWMFCLPLQVDGRGGIDLVAGGKGGGAEIGWFEAPDDPRQLDRWTWHPISPAGWIMSLRAADLDGDGDPDVITTDRNGPMRGCRWLENPGPGLAQTRPWPNHFVGGGDTEAMFMTMADLDADGTDDVVMAVKPRPLKFFRRTDDGDGWAEFSIPLPENIGTGKGVAVGDIDGDGKLDVVFSCEGAGGDRSGVMWLGYAQSPLEADWTPREISGPPGIKFDRLELLDVDADGDLDVLACEESQPVDDRRRGLGVFWYENPTCPAN